MASGVPVRLSAALTQHARTAAKVLDRSLTEQVEHWARLGQVVEETIATATVRRLKARSHDPKLAARLAAAASPEGQARAARLIRERNLVRYSEGADGAIVRLEPQRRPTKPARRR